MRHVNASLRAQLLRRATNAAIAVAVVLTAAKALAFWLSGSVTLLASALDSLLDATASLVNALAVRYAEKPPDDEHRFGHGKAEALASLAQALLITGSGMFVIVRALTRLLHPEPLGTALVSLVVMVFSLLATLGLVRYQHHVVRLTESSAVQADALHYVSDVASNIAGIVSVVLARQGIIVADPLFGIGIALVTLYSAGKIGLDSFQVLMDRELPLEAQERIRSIVLSHAAVRGLHELRTRKSGAAVVIQFHLELDPRISLVESNRISIEVTALIRRELPRADVLIHQDPTPLGARAQ